MLKTKLKKKITKRSAKRKNPSAYDMVDPHPYLLGHTLIFTDSEIKKMHPLAFAEHIRDVSSDNKSKFIKDVFKNINQEKILNYINEFTETWIYFH